MKNNKPSKTELFFMGLACIICLISAVYTHTHFNRIDSKVQKAIETHLATANDSILNNDLMAVYNEE